jgi:hypothetical protein
VKYYFEATVKRVEFVHDWMLLFEISKNCCSNAKNWYYVRSKMGDRSDGRNFREISCLLSSYKIVPTILLEQFTPFMNEWNNWSSSMWILP